jgi:hypothetical protein
MKFAKLLQEEVVPEWRKAYLNYKQGKKYLKAIETAIAIHERATQERLETGNNEGQPLRLIIDSRDPANNGNSMMSGPGHEGPERREEVILDSPTGATPILSQNRGRVRSYDSIRTLPSAPALASDDRLSERSVNTLPGAQDAALQQEQEPQQEDDLGQAEPPGQHDSVVQQNGNGVQSHNTSKVLGKLKRRLTKPRVPERSKRSRVIHGTFSA